MTLGGTDEAGSWCVFAMMGRSGAGIATSEENVKNFSELKEALASSRVCRLDCACGPRQLAQRQGLHVAIHMHDA